MIFCLSRSNDILCDEKTIDAIDGFAGAKYRQANQFDIGNFGRFFCRGVFLSDTRERDKCLQVETLSSSRDICLARASKGV